MALFGTTYHGDYNQLLHAQPVVNAIYFHEVSDDAFEAAFRERALGECSTAAALQVDGATHILRKELLTILPALLRREPSKVEFDTFFTWFDYETSCVMSLHEYRRAYGALKASCAKQGEQRALFSTTLKATDDMRHKRLPYEPQDTLVGDVTEAQRIGWHAPKPHPAKERFFPAGSTDVTRREGRSLADYYGVYTLIGLQR